MRRRSALIVIVAVVAAGFLATWTIAYRLGESDGRDKVSTDRTVFQTRVAGAPQAGGAGGVGQGGGGGGANGGPNARGAGGSAVAGGATVQAGGSAQAGGAAARPGGQGGQTASLTGKVMKVDGTTFSVQRTDNNA